MIKIVDDIYKINKKYYISRLKHIYKELKIKGTIVIKLGSKTESKDLNFTYLKNDFPTDVLSFPFNEKLSKEYYIGDIFICYPIAKEQAVDNNISLEKELLYLMIHGILHLTGYDHEKDQGEMLKLQDQLIKKIEL
jgi:probable rRNA maturation factor